jgi:hypothetical protein
MACRFLRQVRLIEKMSTVIAAVNPAPVALPRRDGYFPCILLSGIMFNEFTMKTAATGVHPLKGGKKPGGGVANSATSLIVISMLFIIHFTTINMSGPAICPVFHPDHRGTAGLP